MILESKRSLEVTVDTERLQDLTFTRRDELAAVFDPRGGHTCGPAAAKADMSTREALLRRSEQQRFLRLMFVYTKCSGWFIQHFWSNPLSGVRIQQDPEDKDRSSQPFSLLCEMSVIFYFIDIVFGRQLALANEIETIPEHSFPGLTRENSILRGTMGYCAEVGFAGAFAMIANLAITKVSDVDSIHHCGVGH
ncbi:hypothetical protein MG293_003720 [Ovis ammon polii]|uniref:Uncharacterized protein n=1 Tax=Ovis ammon polii TaxID=230172 RepID=A0AAD4YDP2_OVIAM|nr:hypothetical protein MG293_003720 [Ovis ammon polii]